MNEETEKKAVDKEGDAVMVVWKVNLLICMIGHRFDLLVNSYVDLNDDNLDVVYGVVISSAGDFDGHGHGGTVCQDILTLRW